MAGPTLTPARSAELFDRMVSCRQFDDVAERVLEPVARQLGARSCVFLQFYDMPADTHMVGRHCYIGAKPRSVEVYADGAFEDDPVVQPCLQYLRARETGDGALVTLLSTFPGWRESDYYRTFLKPFDIGHVLALAVPVYTVTRSEMLCLGFHRRDDDDPFNSGEVDQLRGLAPVIRTVLANLALEEAVDISGCLLEALADEGSGQGFVVLNEDLEIENANARGLEHLSLVGASGLASSEALGMVRHLLLNGAVRPRFTLPQHGSCGGQIEVEVRSLVGEGGRTYHLVLTQAVAARAFDRACRLFGLSDRETDVATLAVLGRRNAEISIELGISLRTVENHLRSIYAKAAVTSRTQLASRLMTA